MTDVRIAFVGAGSVVFTQGLLADLFAFPELARARIALHDIDRERLATAEGAARHIAQVRGAKPEITAHLDRRAALADADFVVNIVQVGMDEATRTDFTVPARYGLRQTIGDTLGIGGIFRALRTFPVLKSLAEDMAELCPDAHLLNYTNPMAMNLLYLSRIAPALRATGLCHSVYWTMHDLSQLVGVPFEEVSYLAAGVNHQAWVLRFERAGQSLHPLLDETIARDPELLRRVRVDMYRRLGHYPTETSEHSAEYVPWYLHHTEEIERLRLPVGAYLEIIEENTASYEHTREALAAGAPLPVEGTLEYAPRSSTASSPARPVRSTATSPTAVSSTTSRPTPSSKSRAWSTRWACSRPGSAPCRRSARPSTARTSRSPTWWSARPRTATRATSGTRRWPTRRRRRHCRSSGSGTCATTSYGRTESCCSRSCGHCWGTDGRPALV